MKLVIFDMDGTLTPQRPFSTAPFGRNLLPNVATRLAALAQQGVFLAVATNQGGAGRRRKGRISTGAVLAQLRWLRHELGLHAIRFATTPARKKPNPAMLTELMDQLQVSAAETLFVGDSETDLLAATAVSVPFVFADVFFSKKEGDDVRK